MLVLTRKVGESILIGESIVVTVVDAGNGKVRLGIAAPVHIQVLRKELRDRQATDALPRHGPVAR